MDKNLCVNGTVIASNDYQPSYPERKKECVFDGNLDTNWGGITGQTIDKSWIGYDFLKPTTIIKIKLHQSNNSNSSINIVSVQGSNNEIQWKEIKQFSLIPGLNILDLSTNNKAFNKYRLVAKTDVGIPTWAWLVKEIEMYGNLYKFLLKQNSNYYSIKNNFYKLGQPNDNAQLEQWYDKYGTKNVNTILEPLDFKDVPMSLEESTGIWKTDFELDANKILGNIKMIEESIKNEGNKTIRYECEQYKIYDKLDNEFEIMMADNK
ncbi:discoidin domain-containing protein [Clostridium tetani]|uniref:discoidin domain-containing protein n=1 Tax=Clostridium tetani TaxID=1513 RepID=UPI0003C0D5EB|nr:discoidin domain-containing protein [Clostridium tetani]CDI49195.1 cell adhesion domain-containing protein [Clostridium tetani 12124569]